MQLKLVALVPKPRVHLTGYNGVFAPHSKYRARVTPAKQEEAEGPLRVGAEKCDSSKSSLLTASKRN